MPTLRFQVINQTIRVAYDVSPALLERVRTAVQGRRDEHLNLNHLASTAERLLVQSPTGTTRVEILPDRADLVTQYFGEFTGPPAAAQRAEYAKAKVRSLVGLLTEAEARFKYVGITNLARCSAGEIGVDRLRMAAVAALSVPRSVSDDCDVFDFTLRVSRIVDANVYSNVNVGWYQTRMATFELPVGVPSGLRILRDWEFPVSDEGIEFRYDRNNKRGLFAGKQAWSSDEVAGIIDATMSDLGPALTRITSAVEARL